MSFDLASVVPASSTFRAQKILNYGVQGIGKSSMGVTFEKPFLLRTEDSGCALDVPTFPSVAKNMEDLIGGLKSLHDGQHDFKTLIVDSIDWAEPIVWAATAGRLEVPSIETPGYGKGYVEADNEWRLIMGWLDALCYNRNMTIVCIAHAEVKKHEPPDGDAFDRYQIKLHKRAYALWQEWADMVLFTNYRFRTIKTKDGGKSGQDKFRGDGSGERMIYTEERPAYLAKNRWSLPPEIYIGQDQTWSAFHKALNTATNGRYALPVKA